MNCKILAVTAALSIAGCGGSASYTATPHIAYAVPDSGYGHIKHIVLVVQENRSFDNLFATFPGADGATHGKMHTGKVVRLKIKNLAGALDLNHNWSTYITDYDGGKMDGFDLAKIDGNTPAGKYPYQYLSLIHI